MLDHLTTFPCIYQGQAKPLFNIVPFYFLRMMERFFIIMEAKL